MLTELERRVEDQGAAPPPAAESLSHLHALTGRRTYGRERARATLKAAELETYLAGGPEELALRQRCVDTLKSDPAFSKHDRYFLTRQQLYKRTLEHQLALPRKVRARVRVRRESKPAVPTSSLPVGLVLTSEKRGKCSPSHLPPFLLRQERFVVRVRT